MSTDVYMCVDGGGGGSRHYQAIWSSLNVYQYLTNILLATVYYWFNQREFRRHANMISNGYKIGKYIYIVHM